MIAFRTGRPSLRIKAELLGVIRDAARTTELL
jgi:hypothetical protein